MPSWDRQSGQSEREYADWLKKRGKEEEGRVNSARYQTGDLFGLRGHDGREGIDLMTRSVTGRPAVYLYLLWIGVVIVIVIAAFTVRACVGEERAQEILNSGQLTSANP